MPYVYTDILKVISNYADEQLNYNCKLLTKIRQFIYVCVIQSLLCLLYKVIENKTCKAIWVFLKQLRISSILMSVPMDWWVYQK